MKFRLFLSMVMLVGAYSVALAQGPPGAPKDGEAFENRRDRIEALRVSYITTELQLTTSESQAFWPVYNEFRAEEQAIRKKYKPVKKVEEMTEAEARMHLDKTLQRESEILDLKTKYNERFLAVLPAQKLAMLTVIDRKFKERVLREMKERRAGDKRPERRN